VRNPPSGTIVTANQRIVGDGYPHHLGLDYARPDRARRVHDRLAGLVDATVDDMAAVHRDTRSLAADVWVPRLVTLEPSDAFERSALDRLRDWDRTMERASVAAAVYVVTRDALCRRLAHDPRLTPLRTPFPDEPAGTFQPLELRIWALSTGLLEAGDTTLLPTGRSWDDELSGALADAVGILRTALGDDVDGWRWGALHEARPHHPLALVRPDAAALLDPPAVSMSGEWDTVMCAAHPAGHGFGVTSASVARYAFDLADWDRSGWIVPLGSSGDARSPHFADQQSAWAGGELVPMRYSWAAIERSASSTTVLRA
jgi:penicillin amidase